MMLLCFPNLQKIDMEINKKHFCINIYYAF